MHRRPWGTDKTFLTMFAELMVDSSRAKKCERVDFAVCLPVLAWERE